MSKSSGRSRRKKRTHVPKPRPAAKPMSDRAVYIGLAVVGIFVFILAWLWADGSKATWGAITLGYIAAIAYLVNFYAFQVYRGKHLGNWQQSLARVPLRFVGYGTRQGRPLEAAHDHPETKMALLFSIAISLALVMAMSFVLIPGLT